ncbi:hypothetical protein J4O75_20810 [Paenibacillus pabuli]
MEHQKPDMNPAFPVIRGEFFVYIRVTNSVTEMWKYGDNQNHFWISSMGQPDGLSYNW